MPSLDVEYRTILRELDRLAALQDSTTELAAIHRKFIAEIAFLRLAILVENTLRSVFCKLACGTNLLDGTQPCLINPQRTIASTISTMESFPGNRRRNLIWNDAKEIRKNVKHILDSSDPTLQTIQNYGNFLTEIKFIRNNIAHQSSSSRANFRKLVVKFYGAPVSSINNGTLLLTPRFGLPPLISKYIITTRVMIKEILHAQ